jgi:hypothetical protein
MKRYSIEWSGIITRDMGWDEVEANSPDEAREKYLKDHGQFRRVRGVIEINDDPKMAASNPAAAAAAPIVSDHIVVKFGGK